LGLGLAGEEGLHQALLVGLEGGELLAGGGDELVERSQAVGDSLYLGGARKRNRDAFEHGLVNLGLSIPCYKLAEINGVQIVLYNFLG